MLGCRVAKKKPGRLSAAGRAEEGGKKGILPASLALGSVVGTAAAAAAAAPAVRTAGIAAAAGVVAAQNLMLRAPGREAGGAAERFLRAVEPQVGRKLCCRAAEETGCTERVFAAAVRKGMD